MHYQMSKLDFYTVENPPSAHGPQSQGDIR